MKHKFFLFATATVFALAVLSSCKSNKPGIVPCPSHHISFELLK